MRTASDFGIGASERTYRRGIAERWSSMYIIARLAQAYVVRRRASPLRDARVRCPVFGFAIPRNDATSKANAREKKHYRVADDSAPSLVVPSPSSCPRRRQPARLQGRPTGSTELGE